MNRHAHVLRGALIVLAAALSPLSADPALDKLVAEGKYKEAIDYADEKLPSSQRDAGAWVLLGRANEGLDMPEKALACYMVGWRMNADDYPALFGAARIYNKLGQPDNAANMAKKALEKNFTAEASWEYARACIALSKPAEAKTALEKVIASDSTNAIANKELGGIYFAESNWQKALPLLKKTYAAKPDGELAYRIGKAYFGSSGVSDSAIAYLKDAVGRGGAPAGAGLELARAYYDKGDMPAAAAQYLRLPATGMGAMDFYRAAVACEKSGNPAAQTAYEKAASLFGVDRSREALVAREKTGRALMARKAYAAASPHFDFIAEADPKAAIVPDIYFLVADAYAAQNNAPKTIASLEKAIALNNKNIEAYARLADLYQKNGMPEKAKQTFENMMALSPNDPSIYLALGQYDLKGKKFEEALAHFGKSNVLKKSVAASEGMAVAAFKLKRMDIAADAAESAITLDSTAWEARVIFATVMMQNNNYKYAQRHLEYMVGKDPSRVEYKEQLAACYVQNGESAKLLELDRQIVAQNPANADSRLRLARDADARNDVEGALALYRQVAVLQPKNADVLHRLYEITLKKNLLGDAALFLGRYCEIRPGAEAQRDYGDVLYQLKDYDRALDAYRAALRLNPSIKGFHKRYAEIVIAKGQHDEVITALTGVIRSGEADAGTYQTLGLIYQKKKDYPNAIAMYQKGLQIDPKSVEILSALAASQAAGGALSDAVISYEQVVMMDTGATEAYHELGDIYFKQGNVASAAKNYRKYFPRAPGDQVVAKRLGKYSYDSKDFPEAVKYLSALRFQSEEEIDYGMMYALSAMATKQYKDAVRALETLRALKPKGMVIRSILKTLADAYEKDGREANAAEALGAYMSLPGMNDPDAAHRHGLLLEKTNPPEALKAYEAYTKQYSGDFRNFLRLGLMLASNKATLPRAAQHLKRTTELAETLSIAWVELGKVYQKLGKEQEELETYRRYLQSDPQSPEANKRVGLLLGRKGQLSESLMYLEIANTMAPNDPDVMAALARGYGSTSKKNEAIDLMKKAKALRPNDTDMCYQLYGLYWKTGQKEKARDEIKALIAISRNSSYLRDYANACIATNDLRAAGSTIEDILAVEADNIDVLMLKAKVQAMNQKYDSAIETYKEISYIDPSHVPSMVERANMYLLQSKPQWAETFFQRALKADAKSARAELGLAKVAKMRKDMAGYSQHLDRARLMDPFDEEIQEEAKRAGK
ncbi:MAG: tetratricopeptide repeat protein [Chitinispirillaceae bacterium]|nr:tetratricopeptide repeat protein [Chitinispirillaceae bacterium]